MLFAVLEACSTTKHVDKTITQTDVQSSITADYSEQSRRNLIDTTRTEIGFVVITEIDFADNQCGDTLSSYLVPGSTATISGVGSFSGVKSIKQTVIGGEVRQSGKSEEDTTRIENKQSANVTQRDKMEIKNTKIEKSPLSSKLYIAIIAAILAVVITLWKRRVIVSWVNKFLSNLLRIGKK